MKKKSQSTAIDRRDFLKTSVIAGGVAAALAGAKGVLAETEPGPDTSQDLKALSAEVRLTGNMVTPSDTVLHDPKACIGCNTCVTVCHQGIMVPNPTKGQPPLVVWPDECWACGVCAWFCPQGLEARAITQNHPINQRVRWKRKATGEHFRIGMKNPPAPNTRPPVGGWKAHA
jgi:NAD-dependent dihydropyrimidine dehydrogenase PreA subunit